jgi:MoaA/NifB/PqqE/SkfB family radical SAM enzyme
VKVRLRSATVLDGLGEVLRLAGEHGATVSVEPAFPLPGAELGGRRVADELRGLRSRYPRLRLSGHFVGRLEEAMGGAVGGCQAGQYFFNVDHRGRVSKCVEFRTPEDRVGELAEEGMDAVLPRLRQAHAKNRCGSCWYASRAEIEGLYTLRGLVGALPELVRG